MLLVIISPCSIHCILTYLSHHRWNESNWLDQISTLMGQDASTVGQVLLPYPKIKNIVVYHIIYLNEFLLEGLIRRAFLLIFTLFQPFHLHCHFGSHFTLHTLTSNFWAISLFTLNLHQNRHQGENHELKCCSFTKLSAGIMYVNYLLYIYVINSNEILFNNMHYQQFSFFF